MTGQTAPPIAPFAAGRPAARASSGERIAAGVVALVILAVLVTAASLRPSGRGIGTHTQLGMPECSWIVMMGKPCPTCGMTTAFASAANLQPVRSILAQPFAAVGTVVCGAVFWGAVHMLVFGSRLGHVFSRMVLRPSVLWPVGAAWAASWVYKVLTMPGAG